MNNNTEAQQAQQRAQQFEQQAQQAKQGEQKAQNINVQLSDSSKPAVVGTEKALDTFKYEVANEVGIPNYDQIDKGNLTARQNGSVGGQMRKEVNQMLESEANK